MKYSYNDIMEPWYPEEFRIIDITPIKKHTYAVSNYGRVKNIITNNILSTYEGNGYIKVMLQCNDGSRKTFQVHILVALLFIPKTTDDIINNRNIVNHKNLLTFQNFVHNLEWVNTAENAAHSHQYRHLKLKRPVSRITQGTWTDSKGSKNGMAKLTDEQVHTMCKMLEDGYSYTEICNHLNMEPNENNKHLISNLVTGKRWKYITKDYDLPKPQQCTDFSKYIIPVCELLEKGLSNKEIVEILNMDTPGDSSYRFINRLRNKKVYHEITKNYNF